MTAPTDARSARREGRRREIQDQACRLVVERGFDGFTMDDLAEAVGVSRRTLFNHVPDKAGAVLGPPLHELPHSFEEFLTGGPTGDLVADVVHVVREGMRQADSDEPDAVGRFRMLERAIAADPKLAGLFKHECEAGIVALADLVCRREGWVAGDLRARTLLARILSTIALMLDEVVRRRGAGSFLGVYDEILAADAELFAARGALAVAGTR